MMGPMGILSEEVNLQTTSACPDGADHKLITTH
jgi:hypothetical protein